MKYIKTVLASFLTVLFLMSGCSTGNKGKDGGSINSGDVKNTNLAASEMKKGAAAQQEITFEKSEKMETLSQLSDGTLLGYNQDYTLKYSSKDNGVTWETAQMNTKNLFPEGEEYPHNTTIDSEGNVYLAFGSQNSQNENDVPFMIQKLSLDGTISKIEIKEVQQFIESGESFDLYQMESLSPDRLLLTFEYGKTFVEYEEGKVAEENGKIKNAVYDPHTGEKVYDVEENQMDYFRGDIYSDDSNWYSPVVTGESSETPMLNCFSVKDGKKLRTIELKDLNENPFQNSHFFISQKTLLVIDRDNIYTVNPESGELTLNISIDYRFAYDEQMTAAQKDDYIKNINTQILSGADADILVLDSLPAKQYAKQGVLADLSDKIDTSDFWANFAEQLKIDDKLFYAPVGFTLPIIQVRKEFFTKYPETFDEWISYIETTATYSEEEMLKAQIADETEEYRRISEYQYPKEKQPFFPVRGFQDIYDLMWAGNEPALIENFKINEVNMEKYLKALKLLADKADVFKYDEEKKAQGFDPDVYEDLSMNFEGDGFSGSYNYDIYDGSAIASMSVESSTPDPLSLEEYQGKSAIMPMPSMNGGTWKPQNLLAINVQSNKQEAAADFIQSVYTPEWQNEWSEFFIPMTKSAYRLSVEKENEMNRERKEELENNPEQMEHWTEEDLKMLEPIEVEKTVQSFDILLQKVKAPVVTDYVVRNVIWEPVLNYAKGDVSLEETMSQIHAKTKIYLAERVQ